MKIKICCRCKKELSINEFSKDKSRKDELNCYCRKCASKYFNKYYQRNREKVIEQVKKRQKEKPEQCWATYTLNSHKHKGCQIEITLSELTKLAKSIKYCSMCGISLSWEYGKGHASNNPSLDRINNDKKININNIQIVCRKCNTTKLNRTMKEFIDYCKLIINKFKEINIC